MNVLHWLLASPWRSGLAAAALAVSRLFDLFGAALVALTALRGGMAAATPVVLIGLLLVTVASWLSGLGLLLVYSVLVLWLPVLGLSLVLRSTGSLALMTQAAALLVGTVVLLWYLVDPAPIEHMRQFLQTQVLPLLQQAGETAELDDEQLQVLARLAPGLVAGGAALIFSLAVMIGRWWQAMAYNPGGFQHDFHRLKQGRSASLLIAVVLLASALTGHPVAVGFAVGGLVTLLLQGIAMVHGVIAATGQPALWLFGMYALLLLLPLPTATVLIVSGGVDNWLDFRRRAGQGAA